MKRLLIGLLITPAAFADSILITNAKLMSMGSMGTQDNVSVLIEDGLIAEID